MPRTKRPPSRVSPGARPYKRSRFARRPSKYKKYPAKYSKFANNVMKVVNQRAEQKVLFREICSNQTIEHNELTNLDDNVFKIGTGVEGEVISTTGAGSVRVGNKIYVKGIKCAINLESQQYRPSVKYTLYLIRRKGHPSDSLTNASDMFEGTTTTLPLDYIDQQKVHILFAKSFYPRMPNSGTTVGMNTAPAQPNGTAYMISGGEDFEMVTNPQVLTKFYVPINKQIKFFDHQDTADEPVDYCKYQWVMIGYDNYTTVTSGSVYPLGHVSLTQKIVFTDV